MYFIIFFWFVFLWTVAKYYQPVHILLFCRYQIPYNCSIHSCVTVGRERKHTVYRGYRREKVREREKPGIHDYIQIQEATERLKEVLFFLCNQNPAHFLCILSFKFLILHILPLYYYYPFVNSDVSALRRTGSFNGEI